MKNIVIIAVILLVLSGCSFSGGVYSTGGGWGQQVPSQPPPFQELGRWCENGIWYVKLQLNPGYRQVTRNGCMSQCYWDRNQECWITFHYRRFHTINTTNGVWLDFNRGASIVVVVPL